MKKRNYAMPSSGNPARDRADLEAFALRQEKLEKGLCPNDDAELITDAPGERRCPVCGFLAFTTPLYVGPAPRN